MSIISEALRKVSDQRRSVVRLRNEELAGIFVDDARKVKSKKEKWTLMSSIGTVFIVGFGIVAFLYNAQPPVMVPQLSVATTQPVAKVLPLTTVVSPTPVIGSVETGLLPIFNLNGVIEGGGESLVMINNNILKKGDYIEGAQIIRITSESVTLYYNNKEIILRID